MSKPMQVYAVHYRDVDGIDWAPFPGISQFRNALARAKTLAKSKSVIEVKLLTFTRTNTRVITEEDK